MAISPEQRRRNLRMGWMLAAVALTFLVGFVVKAFLIGL